MSKAFAALAALLGLAGISLFAVGPRPHSETIEIAYDGRKYTASKGTLEIDYGHETSFTVTNTVEKDLRFVLDAGPSGKCRVNFKDDHHPSKCETREIPLPARGTATFKATAADLPWDCDVVCIFKGDCNYSCASLIVTARPHFQSDIRIGEATGGMQKVDPDLEIERDPPMLVAVLALIGALLSALAGWLTRRRA